MHPPERPHADPLAQQARCYDREQKVKGDCAESDPKRTVGRGEGYDSGRPANRHIGIDDRGENVQAEEDNGQ